MSSHGIGYNDVYHSVWRITDAINLCPKLGITFPTCHEEQKNIVSKFKLKSTMGFENCVGCIDGVLIWTSKSSIISLLVAKLGCNKFFCGQKKCFGLNMQAICDDKRRFLDMIFHTQLVLPII